MVPHRLTFFILVKCFQKSGFPILLLLFMTIIIFSNIYFVNKFNRITFLSESNTRVMVDIEK